MEQGLFRVAGIVNHHHQPLREWSAAECALHDILGSMGGPAAGALLHRVPDDDEILALRTWLEATADFYGASDNADLSDGWEFFLNWPATLGDEPPEGRCLGGLKMFLIDPQAEYS